MWTGLLAGQIIRHCAEIQCHAHRLLAWLNGIVYQVIWATFWHAYVMFLIEFTVNTNAPFRTAKSFQLLEIWTNPMIREAAFRSLGGITHDSCRLNAIRTRQFDCHKPQDHMSDSSVLYWLHILHSKQKTHHDSRRHWPKLCAGECERFSPASNHSCCEGL